MSSTVFARLCGFAATAFLGAALAQADVQPTRILCYGDSTTWGQVGSYADVGGASYPCILQNLLGNRYEVKGICLGGATVADMLVWRGVRELRTKPYYTVKSKTVTESSDSIVLKADGSYTGIAFTGDSNPFCLVTTGEDDICRGYGGYPVFGSATETAGLFWPSHDGAAFTKAEATACGLPAGAYTDYGNHLSDGIGRCRCYYDPKNAARFVDVEIRYSSSLHAAMRLLEPQASDVTIPSGSKIVPIDTTTTWKSDLHIIMFGLNDSGVLKSADYWELIKEATDRIVEDGGRYLVLMSESAGASRPKDWESKMQAYFGNRYLDLHEKFTEKDANGDYKCFAYAEALGYTNVRTNALQAAAKIPVTFQTDKLHPLEIGYDLMAHWVYDKLVELGEVEPEPASGTAVPPAAKTRIRYDGAEKMGVSAGCGYTLSGHLAADAGTYTATATLKSGFMWSDGTTASKPVSWEIEKVAPVWVVCKIEPSTWEEGNPPETISLNAETRSGAAVTCAKTVEQLKALPAGSYKIAFTAAESANYKSGSKSVTVTVTPRSLEPGEVEAPTAATGLKYTGREQTGVAAATGYTVTGGAATDAGDYTATATLADGYKWSDGTTGAKDIAWSIAKGVNTWKTNPSVSPATWSVDAVPGTITIANGATAFGATVTCDTTEAALKALKGGESKTVTFTAAGTKNYDAISKTVTVTVTSGETPVDPDPPEMLLTPTNFTWCGGASGVWKSAENWQVEPGCSSDYPHEKWANVHFPSDADVTLNNTKLYIHNVTAAEGVSLTFRKSSGTNFRPTSPFAPPKNGSIVFDGASLAVSKEGENYSYLTFSLNSSVEFRNGCTLSSAATVFSGSATGGKKFTLRDNGRSFCADFNWRSGKSSTKANPAEIYVTNSVLTCVSETGCQLAVGSSGYTLLHVADGQFHLPCRFTPSGSAYAFRITLGALPETMPTNAPIYFARDVSLSNDVFAVDARACKVAGTYPLVVSGGKSFAVPSDWFDGEGALQATEDFDYTLQVASGMTGKVRQASDYLGLELVLTAGGDDPPPPVDPEAGLPVLTAPADGATVAMLTEKQKMAVANGGEAWEGGGNLGDNKAHPVVLAWTGTTGPVRVTVVRVKDGSTLIDETTDAGTLDAYNMLLGEEYRWIVTTAAGSASRTFTVELQAPRVIMVQDANETDIAELNMRDLGGWVGKDGHRVKQGLLYRSRKLSDPYPEGYDPAAVDGRGYPLLSDAAIFVMTNRFGIRTELDFRSPNDQARGIVRSVLGPNVEYINQGMLQPELLILQSSVGNSMLKAQMDVIFNRSKYPLDFHCKDGNSRTGGLAYYLLGLLGVDIMDAAADYMWTKYSTSKAWTWEATDFKYMYANVTTNHVFTAADGTVYDRGTSFMAVCESFTLANGYTMEEIEAFREFMLEGYQSGEDPGPGPGPGPGPTPVEGVPVLTAPAEGARIDPLSWGQQLARATDYTAPTTADFSRYANPVHLEWTGTTGPAEVTVCRASDGHCIWQCVSETGSCDAYNCYIGEDHVWTVRTEAGSASGHFTVTQLAPRMIYTHNSEACFSNMRDEGGYRGLDGRRVRQGLIYRSCQFDSQSQGGTGGGTPMLDEVGLYDMTNRLGIKTDLDLRNDAEMGGISGSGLGPNVRWIHISGLYPGSVGGSGSPTGTMQKELAVLLDPANYPLDFHCKGGRDRTGALGFVALGLLGVPERDLYLDYVWTWDMPDPAGHIGDWDAMIAGLAKLEGNTICEKLETLVRQCGFTDADIAAYREAMLEPLADPPVHFHDTALTEHVAPTCSAEGRDVYSCTNAGCTVPPYAVTNTLPVVEHVWGDWTVVTEPTLGQAGLRRRTCSVCTGTEEIAIDALKPAAEATGADWGQVVTQEVDGVRQVTVTFTGTTCDWRWTLPQEVTKFDFLAVAGGGSGGVSRGGGGGAGGVVTGTVAVAQAGATVRAMVGAGGAAQTATGDGNDGESSYLRLNDAEVLAVYGGGGGGHYEDGRESFGRAGGNGGGAGGNGVGATVAGGAARAPHFGAAVTKSAAFGTAGGAGATSGGAYPGGGGGGGALMAGGDGTPKGGGGAGGDGLVGLLGGEETCFAGGGGGACAKSTPGPGGAGGGGTGGDTPTAGADGLGGGGGGSRSTRYGASGAGGSGIVVIRYVLDGSEPPGPPPGPGPDDPEPMDEGWGWSNRVTVAGQDYCVLAFTNTAAEGFAWTVPSGVTAIDYLVVGGGGGGGANKGGGGGAGFATNGTQNVAAGGTLSIRVGAGGAGATYVRDGAIVPGENGKDSSLAFGMLSITAQGGGGGTYNRPGESGGCGGGGASSGKQVGGAGSQGWCGYKAVSSYGGGGGGVTGGGAAPGGASGTAQQQAGGPGLECTITGETLTYGAGGAGNKGSAGTVDPVAGTDGTGNGGGAGEGAKSGFNGGSGVVIIRYAVAEGPVPQKDPVIPGGESKTYATEAAAIAAKPEKVTPPDDVAQALAEKQEALVSYIACFTVATRQNAAGQWVNVAELKSEVEAELQRQVDGGAAKVVDTLADVSLTSVTLEPVTPGFRYAFEYGETLGTMAPQDSVIATEDSLALPLPKTAGATSGFYRVKVREY